MNKHRVDKDLVCVFFRALKAKLLPFCQFHTSEEHEQFVDNVSTGRKLSRRLAELLRYRRFGLTDFSELPEFEKERIARQSPLKVVSTTY